MIAPDNISIVEFTHLGAVGGVGQEQRTYSARYGRRPYVCGVRIQAFYRGVIKFSAVFLHLFCAVFLGLPHKPTAYVVCATNAVDCLII